MQFNCQLDRDGLIARKGQRIDACFIKAENIRIKADETVEG